MILPHSVVVDFVNKSLKGDTRTNLDDLLWNTLKVRSSTKSPSNPATTISVDEIGPAQRSEVPSGPPSEDYLDFHVSEGLAILNYTSGSPRGHPVADHCRGLILDLGMLQNGTRPMTSPGRGSSPIVAACMPRYFNYGESFQWPGNGTEESLPIAQTAHRRPLDGTYIQVFRWNGRCELSTRGTIGGGAFRAPFLKALRRASAAASCADDEAEEAFFQRSFSDAFDAFDIHTLWFEYTSPNNQIVTLYSDERATLLGGFYRNGKELSRNDIGELKATPAFSQTAVCIPIMFPSTVETLRKSFGSEQQADAADDKNHGSNVEEGFVVYIGDRRWKVKNPKWVLLHEWRFNLNPTKILENIFTRKDDLLELIATVPEEAVIYDPYFKMIDSINERIRELWNQFRGNPRKYQESAAVDDVARALFGWFRNDDAPIDFEIDPGRVGNIMKARMKAIEIMGVMPSVDANTAIASTTVANTKLIVPSSFTVFGCSDSTDVNVCIFAKSAEEFAAEYDLKEIQEASENAGKPVSVTVVNVVEGPDGVWRVNATRQGSAALIHNMVFRTARSPIPLTTTVPLSTKEMVQDVAIHLFRSLKDLLSKDTFAAEQEKRRASSDADLRIGYALEIMCRSFHPQDTHEWRSAMKTLVMKMVQTCLYWQDQTEAYHKQKLSSLAAEKLDLPEEVLIWYLYRGTRGVRDEAGKSFTLVVADDLDGGASTSNI
ncbi:hypothetical protein DFJ73DRAFT_869768 [Zopfochytrium polystomum]|nr:hypothetical protein DFJ73DRAFT_869768 [Zopfochytrium polystomum]